VGLGATFALTRDGQTFSERFQESSPVEFRMALYQAGWDMFREKPLLGWNAADVQAQLEQRIDEFHQEAFYFHNTFLEVGVAYGIVGLGLYLWLIMDLVLLSRRRFAAASYAPSGGFLDAEFRSLWLMMLFVYILNACFVVMNYQFVNGFIFTLAGMMAAQDGRLAHHAEYPAGAMLAANSFGF
jgi:O-antigen ligase